MRILFTYAGSGGHADPLVPIAIAARNTGHENAFLGDPDGRWLAQAMGFPFLGPQHEPAPRIPTPLVPMDMEHEFAVLRDHYAGKEARRRTTTVLEACDAWHPDVIVCDEVDFGAMIAAERLGLPHAEVAVTASGSFLRADVVTPSLDRLREEHGLGPDPGFAMLGRHRFISPFPPSLRDPAFPAPPTTVSIQAASVVPPGTWTIPRVGDRPLVYVTLGTVFNTESGDLFDRVLAGLDGLPVDVLVTVGREMDPATLGPQSDHVTVTGYIPQAVLLPLCATVIHHGGSGTLGASLVHGLPQLILPMGADQAPNSERVEALGFGIAHEAFAVVPDQIRDATTRILEDRSYRSAAEQLRDEQGRLTGLEAVVPLLAELIDPTG